MSTILTDLVETPIGPMLLMVEDDVVIGLEFDDQPERYMNCLLYTSPSPRDRQKSRMPSSA